MFPNFAKNERFWLTTMLTDSASDSHHIYKSQGTSGFCYRFHEKKWYLRLMETSSIQATSIHKPAIPYGKVTMAFFFHLIQKAFRNAKIQLILKVEEDFLQSFMAIQIHSGSLTLSFGSVIGNHINVQNTFDCIRL